MLRATASAGAQVRECAALAAEANLASLAAEGRPRAVVVAGQGTAARTGDLLATVAGTRCPVPVIAHRTTGVPGWVGAADVVIAVSRFRAQPRGAGRGRCRGAPRRPPGRDRSARHRAAVGRRAGPSTVHPGAPPRPGPREHLGAHGAGAAGRPHARAGQGQRGRPGGDRGPARRRRRSLPPGGGVVRQPGEGARARPRRLDPDRVGLVAAGDRRRPPVRRHALVQRPLPGGRRRPGRGRPWPRRSARRCVRRSGRGRARHLRRRR